jgi:MFS family permease
MSAAPELRQRALAKVKRALLLYFIAGMVFVQLDKTSIGFATLTMSKELRLTATAFGFASGVFSLASFLVQLPASILFERLGPKRWMTAIMIIWGLVCAAQAFVTDVTQLFVLRFLLGAAEAGFLPGLFILVSLWFRGSNHGMAVSCVQIGTAAAGVIGGPIAGWLLGHTLFGLSGWRGLFLIEGGLTIAFAVIALRILADGPKTAAWLKADEQDFMLGYLDEYQAQKSAHGAIDKGRLRDALRDRRILMLAVSYACAGWAASTVTFFTPTLLRTAGKGMDVMTVGLLSMVPYIVNVVVAFGWGAHADRTNERHWHTVLPILVAISGALLYPAASTPAMALLALVLIHAGNTGLYVNFWATCTSVVGASTVAKSTAIINSGSAATTFIAPVVFGWTIDATGSSRLGLYLCTAVLLLNFVVLNLFFLKKQSQQAVSAAAQG